MKDNIYLKLGCCEYYDHWLPNCQKCLFSIGGSSGQIGCIIIDRLHLECPYDNDSWLPQCSDSNGTITLFLDFGTNIEGEKKEIVIKQDFVYGDPDDKEIKKKLKLDK